MIIVCKLANGLFGALKSSIECWVVRAGQGLDRVPSGLAENLYPPDVRAVVRSFRRFHHERDPLVGHGTFPAIDPDMKHLAFNVRHVSSVCCTVADLLLTQM